MAQVYAYYRIAPEDAAVARHQAEVLQAFLTAYCGSVPRLMRRCDDPATWMEVYEKVADPETFSDAMEQRLNAPGLEILRRSERHVECFREV